MTAPTTEGEVAERGEADTQESGPFFFLHSRADELDLCVRESECEPSKVIGLVTIENVEDGLDELTSWIVRESEASGYEIPIDRARELAREALHWMNGGR
jgi:hypothetical protein